jgi:nucleoside-diphosphate-sugar epimerase
MNKTYPISIIGCGYIGKRLAVQLQARDLSVHGYVSGEDSRADCEKLDIPCDIIDLDNVGLGSPLPEIDLGGRNIIYLAPPPRSGQTDTRMTNFLQAIDRHKPERFVLISTTGVYGDCKGDWIDESMPLNPTADRAKRRADAEQQVKAFCHDKNIALVILRVAGIYGPEKIPAARIKSGAPIVNQQDSPFTNRIHAVDLVNICEQALLDTKITGTYNVTDGHPGTMYEYFTGVAKALDLSAPPAITLAEAQHQLSEGMLSYMAESRRIDNKKLLKDFGLTLEYPSLQQGLDMIT